MRRANIIGIGCLLFLIACNKKMDLTPQWKFLGGNKLLINVAFTTQDSSALRMDYWLTQQPDKVLKSAYSRGIDHSITLLNLKPASNYSYVVRDESNNRQSEVFQFNTGELPPEVTNTKKIMIDTTQFNGYVLIRGLLPRGCDVIIDRDGDVVWYHQYDTAVRRPFAWTSAQTILSVADTSQIVEFDLLGEKRMDLNMEEKPFPNMLHHDIIFNNEGDIVALTHDSAKMDLRGFGGRKNQYVRADGIVVLAKDGTRKWDWNLLDVFDPVKSLRPPQNFDHSLGHANSVAIDNDGNYILSLRDFSQIWKVNATNGEVIWKLGKDGDMKMNEEGYFIRQHSAHINSQGDLMLFDNGDRKNRPYSRILSFKIDEERKIADLVVNIKLSQELSADKMCNAELIGDDKYLVCTSKKRGIITVVDNEGSVLWRVDLTNPSYRAYYLRDPFRDRGR